MTTHRLYGLTLESSVALPGLPTTTSADPRDVRFNAHAAPEWAKDAAFVESHRSEEQEGDVERPVVVLHEAGPGRFRLTYAEGITFHLDVRGGEVWSEWEAPLTLEDAVAFLVGPVLGLFLRRRGVLAMHASGVVLRGRAIGIVAAAGQGKSTLAAALVLRGAALLSDDLLVLAPATNGWEAQPGYPLVRLWEDSATLLFGAAHDLPRLSPTWEKRAMTTGGDRHFHSTPAPLGAILVLGDVVEGISAPRLSAARGAETLLELISNTYGALLAGDAVRAPELAAIAQVVAAVPLMRLERPHSAGPAAVAAVIEEWFAATATS